MTCRLIGLIRLPESGHSRVIALDHFPKQNQLMDRRSRSLLWLLTIALPGAALADPSRVQWRLALPDAPMPSAERVTLPDGRLVDVARGAVLDGHDVELARASPRSSGGSPGDWQLWLSFREAAHDKLRGVSRNALGRQLLLLVDGRPVHVATVRGVIATEAVIPALSEADAKAAAEAINGGRTVSTPTLSRAPAGECPKWNDREYWGPSTPGLEAAMRENRREDAAALIAPAVARSDPSALYLAGGLAEDPAVAALHYQKAADKGYLPAMLALASLYQGGTGVPRDERRALELIEAVAKRDELNHFVLTARSMLTLTYEQRGSPEDVEAARYWRERSLVPECARNRQAP
jgi:hypothetical protein